MNSKKSFILYHDTYEPIKALSQEQKGNLLDAIFHYCMDNHEDKLSPIVALAFQFIKNYLDRDFEKWEKRAGASRENGIKGGRPVSKTSKKSKPRKPTGLSRNLDEPRKPVSVNVSANVSVSDINTPTEKPLALVESTSLYNSINKAFLSKNEDKFTNYGKEGKGIKGLILKASAREEENPELFIQKVIEQFYKMTCNGDKFWSSQPFLPSVLNSDNIFDRVLKQVSKPRKPEEIKYERVEGLFGN